MALTLTEAVNLGKVYGIDTAETILAAVLSKVITTGIYQKWDMLTMIRDEFKKECAAYKSQIDKSVTEDEKIKLTES